MKISNDNLLRLAGLAALLAGICYVLVGLFHPANLAASVTTTRWQVVHVLACAMCFFGLLGMTGLYLRQAVKTGWVGLAGYLLLTLWLTLVMGFSFVEAFILPHVASAAPGLVHSWMGMLNSPLPAPSTSASSPRSGTRRHPCWIGGGLLFGIATVPCRHPAPLGRGHTARAPR